MRCSEGTALLVVTLLPAALLDCDSRDDRASDVCITLADCSDYLDQSACETQLGDALDDGRISRVGLTRCAHCLSAHDARPSHQRCTPGQPCEKCQALFVERDCDTACSEVGFVLRSRTTKAMRQDMCTIVDQSCGPDNLGLCEKERDQLFTDQSCLSALGNTTNAGGQGGEGGAAPCSAPRLDLEASLALDATVEQCWSCTQSVAKSLTSEQLKPARCARLLSACSATCSLVRPVNDVLAPAKAALSLCNLTAQCASPPEQADQPRLTRLRSCTSDSMTTTATTATPPQTDPNDADAQLAEQQRLCFEQQSSCSDSTFWSATRLCLECVAGNDCGYAALHCRDSCEAPN